MVLTVDDKVLANTATNPVVINLENDRYKAVVPEDNVGVSINDSYHVMPWAKRITVDYDLPEYLTQGVLVDIDQLRADLLFEVAARELAFVEATDYAKTYTDGISSQIYTDLNANYVSNIDAQAYILKTELAALQITYDTGSGLTTSSFQELNDTVVAVENAQASYTEDLNIHVTNTSALADRTTTLEAGIGDVAVSIVGTDSVQIDPLGTYTASASKLIIGPAGDITGWSAISAQDPTLPYPSSDFIISADVFKVSNGATKYSPMIVNTVDGTVDFAANVRFTGLGLRGDSTEIDGGLLTTNTINADRFIGDTVWVNGSLQDTAFNTLPNYTTGFQLTANAAGTFADPNIYGAYMRGGDIYGVNIESATLVSSTISARDLVIVTDYGKNTSSVINPVVTGSNGTYTGIQTVSLYSPNSTLTPRIASSDSSILNYIGIASANGWIEVGVRTIDTQTANQTMTMTISVGGVTASSAIGYFGTVVLLGHSFYRHRTTITGEFDNYYRDSILVKPVNTLSSSGTTDAPLVLTMTTPYANQLLFSPKELAVVCYNI